MSKWIKTASIKLRDASVQDMIGSGYQGLERPSESQDPLIGASKFNDGTKASVVVDKNGAEIRYESERGEIHNEVFQIEGEFETIRNLVESLDTPLTKVGLRQVGFDHKDMFGKDIK